MFLLLFTLHLYFQLKLASFPNIVSSNKNQQIENIILYVLSKTFVTQSQC